VSATTCATCGMPLDDPSGRRRYCSPGCWPSRRFRYAARDAATDEDGPGDAEEVERLLWRAARRGSVAAILQLLKQTKGAGRPSVIDELAKRREG
jgi:hypothetical protein